MENTDIVTAIKMGLGSLALHLANVNYQIIIIWLIVASLDTVAGVCSSGLNGEFRSRTMKDGLVDKILTFLLICMIVFVDILMHELGFEIPASEIIIGALCFVEVSSLLETMVKRGMNLPKVVVNWFEVGKEQINKHGSDEFKPNDYNED